MQPKTFFTLLTLLLLAAPAARAQDAPEPPRAPDAPHARHHGDCRCVDEDGDEIEDCMCMRMPHVAPMPPAAFRFFEDGEPLRAVARAFAPGPRLGVQLRPAGGDGGAVVEDVVEGSPAEEAGLQSGDVITHFAGTALFQPIEDEEDHPRISRADAEERPVLRLIHLVRSQEAGDTVAVRYVRDGTSREALAVLERRGGFAFAGPGGAVEVDGEEIRIRMREVREEMERRIPEMERRMEEVRERMEEARARMEEARANMPRVEIRDGSLFLFRGDSLVESYRIPDGAELDGEWELAPGRLRIHRAPDAPRPPRMRPARQPRGT